MNTSYNQQILKFISGFLRLALVLAIVTMCIVTTYYVAKYAYPFIIALILAVIINPAVNFVEAKIKLPRGLSVIIVMFGLFGSFIGMFSLFTMEIINGLTSLMTKIPSQANILMNDLNDVFFHRLILFWQKTMHIFYTLDASQQKAILENIQGLNQEVTLFISNLGTGFLSALTRFIVNLPSALTIIIIIILSTFFMSKDWNHISPFLRSKLTRNVSSILLQVLHELKNALAGYFRAQCALMSITGAIMMIFLSILHVNHAFTISLLTALIDCLPYVGTGAVLAPWSLYSLLTGQTMMSIYLIGLYFLLVIIRQILEPKMLASSIGLNPLATLIVVFIGFQLFGLLGLFLGPGFLVLLKSLNHAQVFQIAWAYITHVPEK